jgi:hypothetical protein
LILNFHFLIKALSDPQMCRSGKAKACPIVANALTIVPGEFGELDSGPWILVCAGFPVKQFSVQAIPNQGSRIKEPVPKII